MAKSKKYYVVWEGNNTGIFDTWSECQLQIKGYPNAIYKAFKSKEEARQAYNGNYRDYYGNNKKPKAVISEAARADIIWNSISVDAACSGNPGVMEYRGVHTKSADEIFRVGPFRRGTNNIGEFLALVHGIAYLQQTKQFELPIYSDSKIAMGWIKKRKINTKLERTAINDKMFKLITRGEQWLKSNQYANPILKWQTKEWGEIPADFGRK